VQLAFFVFAPFADATISPAERTASIVIWPPSREMLSIVE